MASGGVSGHCLCGQVRYTVDKAPAWVGPAFDALPEH